MHVLEFTLSVLTVAGAWRPLSWTSLMRKITYVIYTVLLNVLVLIFAITQIMHVLLNANNLHEITELYMVLAGITGNFKIITMNINQQSFADMINKLSQKPFKPTEENEMKIQAKFNKMIKLVQYDVQCSKYTVKLP